jgi:acetyltransferase-like isoleucine patch superfamily enzyme
MILAFDALWILGGIPVYGVPAVAAAGVFQLAASTVSWPAAALVAPLAYFAFLFVLVGTVGIVRKLLPRERPGTSRVFVDREFFAFLMTWGLEAYVNPFISHIQLLTVLRVSYLRLMGGRAVWSTHVSPGARIWNPGMMRLGHLTYIGEHCHLSGHLSQGDKLLVAPIEVGDRTNLGAHVHIAPGCTIGNDVRIGALTDMAPGCEIGDHVEIGPRCAFGMAVRVEEGAKVEPMTFLDSYMTVPAGEIWGGNPARKLGEVRDTPGERRRRARRAGVERAPKR